MHSNGITEEEHCPFPGVISIYLILYYSPCVVQHSIKNYNLHKKANSNPLSVDETTDKSMYDLHIGIIRQVTLK